jgi:hypothetical protein
MGEKTGIRGQRSGVAAGCSLCLTIISAFALTQPDGYGYINIE